MLKLRIDGQNKKIYCTLYYNNIDRRIEQSKKKKIANNQTITTNQEIQNVLNRVTQQQPQELNVQQMINQQQ